MEHHSTVATFAKIKSYLTLLQLYRPLRPPATLTARRVLADADRYTAVPPGELPSVQLPLNKGNVLFKVYVGRKVKSLLENRKMSAVSRFWQLYCATAAKAVFSLCSTVGPQCLFRHIFCI